VADRSASAGRIPAPDLSRRALLTASAAALPLLLTACRGIQVLGTPPPPPADVRTLQSAIAAEEAMIARYAAALKQLAPDSVQYRDLAGEMAAYTSARAVQAEHVAHLAQLKSRLIEPPGTRPSAHPPPANPTATPSPTPSPSTTSSSPTATGERGVLGELELAEQDASDRLIAELGGLPPSLAQLFASIAASEATHVEYLRAAGRGR
jgi:Ferritin-like domain